MNRSIFFTAVFAAGAMLCADVIKNPDGNTLWLENGKNIAVSPENTFKSFVWRSAKIKITPHEKHGFMLEGTGTTGVYILSSSQYPWLCLDIDSAERTEDGYYALNLVAAPKTGSYGSVSRIPRGKYYFSVSGTPGLNDKPAARYMRLDLSRAKIHVNSLTMLKTPPCLPEVTPSNVKKGDTVEVRCKLTKKAQQVEFKFYQSYTMPNLKPSKEIKRCEAKEVPGSSGLEWSFTFPYQGFAGAAWGRDKKGFKKGEVLLQIMVETEDEVTDHFFFLPNTFQ